MRASADPWEGSGTDSFGSRRRECAGQREIFWHIWKSIRKKFRLRADLLTTIRRRRQRFLPDMWSWKSQTQVLTESMKRAAAALTDAFQKQLGKMVENEVTDMEADVDVLEQMMRMEGLK